MFGHEKLIAYHLFDYYHHLLSQLTKTKTKTEAETEAETESLPMPCASLSAPSQPFQGQHRNLQ